MHSVADRQVPESSGVAVIKSGSDFRNFSRIQVYLTDPGAEANAIKVRSASCRILSSRMHMEHAGCHVK